MNFRKILAVCILMAGSVLEANAGVIAVTTTGTLHLRPEVAEYYGQYGQELVGQYVLQYFYSREDNWFNGHPDGRDLTYGGAPFQMTLATSGPLVSITGVSASMWQDVSDNAAVGDGDRIHFYSSGFDDNYHVGFEQLVKSDADWISEQPRLGQSFSRYLSAGDVGTGYLNLLDKRATPGQGNFLFRTEITSISMYEVSNEVPEPGSLALMCTGLLGAIRYRRKLGSK